MFLVIDYVSVLQFMVQSAPWILCFTALAFLFLWVQNLIYHSYRGYRILIKIGPVILEPAVVLSSVVFLISPSLITKIIALFICAAMFFDGFIGLYFHLRGTSRYAGGFSYQNIFEGPPPLMPLVASTLALVGFAAVLGMPA